MLGCKTNRTFCRLCTGNWTRTSIYKGRNWTA